MNKILKETLKLVYQNTPRRDVLTVRRCTTPSTPGSGLTGDVPGLSKRVVDVPTAGVGFPEATKQGTYKNPEYFCYHNVSFFEAEVEMNKYRLPQPSNKVKTNM